MATLLEAVREARGRGALISAPVSGDDLRVVLPVLDRMGIDHNIAGEGFCKAIVDDYPAGYSEQEIMRVQRALPVDMYRVYDPRAFVGCNYGADADAFGNPIRSGCFYLEYTNTEGEAWICSGPCSSAQAAAVAADQENAVLRQAQIECPTQFVVGKRNL